MFCTRSANSLAGIDFQQFLKNKMAATANFPEILFDQLQQCRSSYRLQIWRAVE